ncbi:MAG: hypothetical protein ACLVLC_08580 [Finegoldia magna]
MKISSFEASLIRNIKFSMVIFLASIVCLNGQRDDCRTSVGQVVANISHKNTDQAFCTNI